MKTVGVLPCPFCGELPRAERYEGGLFIGCEAEKCAVQPSVWDLDDSTAVDDWNTRNVSVRDQHLHRVRVTP